MQYRSRFNQSKGDTPPSVAPIPKEVLGLVDNVKKKAKLPKDETPNVATVKDVNKLSDQAFFNKAKNGDKVLIYVGYQKAFLYRPSTDEIIQESAVEIIRDDEEASASASEEQQTASSAAVLRIKI